MSREVPLQGFGSGLGGVVNFRVFSCSSREDLPETARENTFAVIDTDQVGTYQTKKCVFSAQKTDYESGDVWVELDTQSPYWFPVIQGQKIYVHPVACYSKGNGVTVDPDWIRRSAFIYQNGAWHDLYEADLYLPGDECSRYTGGWKTYGATYTGNTLAAANPESGSESLIADLNPTDYSYADAGLTVGCAEKLELSRYSKVVFTGTFTRYTSNSEARFSCWSSLDGSYQENVAVYERVTATGDVRVILDVSGLSGEYYVGFGLRAAKLELTGCGMYETYLEE